MALPPETNRRQDRLDAARLLLQAVFFFSALSAGAMIADGCLRSGAPVEAPKAAVNALHLSCLALVPSGRDLRLPGPMRRGVDLRHDAGLPRPAPELSGLLLPITEPDFVTGVAR